GSSRVLASHSEVVRKFAVFAVRESRDCRSRKAATPARIARIRIPEPWAPPAKRTSPMRRLPRGARAAVDASVVVMVRLRSDDAGVQPGGSGVRTRRGSRRARAGPVTLWRSPPTRTEGTRVAFRNYPETRGKALVEPGEETVRATVRHRCGAERVRSVRGGEGGQRSQGRGPQRSVEPHPRCGRSGVDQLATWIWSSTFWIFSRVASESGAEPASSAAACWP